MFEVTRKARFSAAHLLREYPGACARPHGHNWTLEVVIRAAGLNAAGMVLDFLVLGRAIDEVIERVDHRNLNEIPPFDRVNPTSENLAAWFHQELTERLRPHGVAPHLVRVWEVPDCTAAYWKE